MSTERIPMSVAAIVGEVIQRSPRLGGSHQKLDALFYSAGAPGPTPNLSHPTKWKTWISQASNDPEVDSLQFLGSLIEEFMDLPPATGNEFDDFQWEADRQKVIDILEGTGLQYFQGGRIIPLNQPAPTVASATGDAKQDHIYVPKEIDALLERIIRGLPRAMHPLVHRRKGATCLSFENEYDLQDLLHSQLRPWIADIRPEEFTPSYAGSSTRMDFLFPKHKLVIEVKRVRDRQHGKKIGDELIIDIEHYRRHPQCDRLWCVIYDPDGFIPNPAGMSSDLSGDRTTPDGNVSVRIEIVSQ